MKVRLDTSALRRPGADRGIGRYVRSIIRDVGPLVELDEWSVGGSPSLAADAWALFRRQLAARDGSAVFHAPGPMTAVPFPRKAVVSVLDLIPLDAPFGQRTGRKMRLVHKWAARGDAIVTLSSFSAERIERRLGVAPSQIFVAPIPPALPDPAPVDALRRVLPPGVDSYVVAVADRRIDDTRKRQVWLSAVGARLKRDVGVPLVVVGPATDCNPLADTCGVGAVDDATLARVLHDAVALVWTSAYEGQGLPPMEALKLGTPVAAMRNSALPEMLGPGALFVDEVDGDPGRAAVGPHTVDDPGAMALADATVGLVADPALRATLADAGRRHVAAFDAGRFARGHLEAYTAAAAQS